MEWVSVKTRLPEEHKTYLVLILNRLSPKEFPDYVLKLAVYIPSMWGNGGDLYSTDCPRWDLPKEYSEPVYWCEIAGYLALNDANTRRN